MDEIIIDETQKVSAAKESPGFLESNYGETELYQVENMSLEETKEKLKWRKRAFECEHKYIYRIENQNDMTLIHDKKVNKISE